MLAEDESKALDVKIQKFEHGLTSDELIRLRQLRSTDPSGKILFGEESLAEAQKRAQGVPHMSNEQKLSIQASLDAKLQSFQETLDEKELLALLCQLSTKSFKVQSNFGVCD